MVRKETPNQYELNGPGSGVTKVEFFADESDLLPVVSYIHGYPGVIVASHEPGWGSVPVSTPERLKTLRDGLIEACKHHGIE